MKTSVFVVTQFNHFQGEFYHCVRGSWKQASDAAEKLAKKSLEFKTQDTTDDCLVEWSAPLGAYEEILIREVEVEA